MKVKVLIKFKDKHNGEIYAKGRKLDITEERYEEILETGLLVEKVEEPEENAEEQNEDGEPEKVEEPEEKPKATTSKKGAKSVKK